MHLKSVSNVVFLILIRMKDSISSNFQMVSLDKCLNWAKWAELKEPESGFIFTDEYLASNWDGIAVHPEVLPKGEATQGMRKVTSPVLLLKSHSSKMAYVLATKKSPVYFCSPFKRTKEDGYTMLFGLKPNVWPEYFFYMSRYNSWCSISHQIDAAAEYELCMGFHEVGYCHFDGYEKRVINAETVFFNGIRPKDLIPPISLQRQQIDDAKMMEKVTLDRMLEKERKFQQKEWLNETHIRNSKHRLSNEVMPVRMAVERLERFLINSSEGIKLSSIVGQATQQTVGDLLNNLKTSIQNIEVEINNLTKSETVGEQLETLEVEPFVRGYCENLVSKFNRHFRVNVDCKDNGLKIKISRKSFMELLDNIFSNAVRHGFTDNERRDYLVLITLSKTDEGFCKIDIANNGNPISERGRNEYFVRGSFAGKTGHTGIGGARVFEICENFNGKAIAPYSVEGFPVVISMEFPIFKVGSIN